MFKNITEGLRVYEAEVRKHLEWQERPVELVTPSWESNPHLMSISDQEARYERGAISRGSKLKGMELALGLTPREITRIEKKCAPTTKVPT